MLKAGVEEVTHGPRLHLGVEEAVAVVLAGVAATANQGRLQSGREALNEQKEGQEAQGDTVGRHHRHQKGGNTACHHHHHLITDARPLHHHHHHHHQGGPRRQVGVPWRMMVVEPALLKKMATVEARAPWLGETGPGLGPPLRMMMSTMGRQKVVNLVS